MATALDNRRGGAGGREVVLRQPGPLSRRRSSRASANWRAYRCCVRLDAEPTGLAPLDGGVPARGHAEDQEPRSRSHNFSTAARRVILLARCRLAPQATQGGFLHVEFAPRRAHRSTPAVARAV